MLLMYVFAYLDRANIGFAKQAYQASTGITESVFAFGASVFFLTYALLEVPSNLMLHRVGARRWMARIMIVWGLISAGMAFARTESTFTALRLLLGAAEAGFFPGSILYLTYWFPARERGQVMGVFYFGAPIAMMLGGPVSGKLLELHGAWGLEGWQLMFLVEGVLASLVGVWAYFYLTDRPAQADWMPPAERQALSQTLALEEAEKQSRGAVGFAQVFRNRHLLHFALIYFLIQTSGYGVAFYLPSIVGALLGKAVGFQVGVVSAIPWACAILAGLFWPAMAVKTGYRRTFACISLSGIGVGLVLAGKLPPHWAIAALCLVTTGIITAQPIFWTFPTAYFGGVGAAAGIAAINAIGNVGGFVSSNAKTWLEGVFKTSNAGLYFLACSGFLAALLMAFVRVPELTGRGGRQLDDRR
jgi:sugar phosphate permease